MRSRCGRERTRVLVAAVGVLAALALPAAAQDADRAQDERLGLDVTVGYGDDTAGADWAPVLVTLQPPRLVAGTLAVEARTATGTVREERDVEVAVGSRSAYRFLLPAGAVTVTLHEPDRDPASVRVAPGRGGDTFLAGVLGTVPSGTPPLRNDALGVTGRWVDVDPEWAELSAAALDPLSGLVADGRALSELSEQGQRNVAAAVAAGMDLVLVGATPEDAGLPWRTGGPAWELPAADLVEDASGVAATVLPAGRGRVALTGAGPGDGALGQSPALWSALVEPRIGADPQRQPAPALQQVGGLAGAIEPDVPTLPWLAVFIVAYIVVVGPVNGIVLARFGRRELAWVTVPAVTAVFTLGGWLGAVGSQPPLGFTGTATAWVDGAATEWVATVARAPTPAQRQVSLPGEGWAVHPVAGGAPAAVRRGDAVRVSLDLPALQPGTVLAGRSTAAPAPLEVSATATGGDLEVTVTNVASFPVSGVVVRAATATVSLGDLAPGAEDTVTVDGDALPADDGGWQGGRPQSDTRGTLEGLLGDVLDGNPGLVWAVGTAPQGSSTPRIDGQPATEVGHVVAVAAHATGPPLLHTTDRTLVQAGDGFRPAPLVVESQGAVVLRYRIPPTGIGAPLRADLDPQNFGQPPVDLALWQHTERQWRPLDDVLPGGDGGPGDLVSPLGEVYVRAGGPLLPLGFSPMGLTGETS